MDSFIEDITKQLQNVLNRLHFGKILDVENNSYLEKDDLLEKSISLKLLPSDNNSTSPRKAVDRVNVTKGLQRTPSVALGFQRTVFSPKELFKSVCNNFFFCIYLN